MLYPEWVEEFNRIGMLEARDTVRTIEARAYSLQYDEGGSRMYEESMRTRAAGTVTDQDTSEDAGADTGPTPEQIRATLAARNVPMKTAQPTGAKTR